MLISKYKHLANKVKYPNRVINTNKIKKLIKDNILNAWDLYDINHYNDYKNFNKNINNPTFEHIWPSSFISKKIKYAHYDLHNLHITDKFYNIHRSNYKYHEKYMYSDSLIIIKKNQNYFTKKTIENNDYSNLNNKFNYLCNTQHIFIPIIYSRGIISRSIMYMLALYGNENYINYIIDYDIMLNWNIKYPPCDREIERNEKIFLLQGNKNPFINEYKV